MTSRYESNSDTDYDRPGPADQDINLKLALPGFSDHHFYERLHARLRPHVEQGLGSIVLDCSAVTALNDAAVLALVRATRYAAEHGVRLTLLDAPAHIYDELAPRLRDTVWAYSC